jgi:hypothetical protein
MHAHPTHMSISKKLDRLDLEIHEIGQKMSPVDGNVTYHRKNN